MQWEEDAQGAVADLPFAKRRKVIARAEAAVLKAGRNVVTAGDIDPLLPRPPVVDNYESDGYRVEVCSGGYSCANRAHRKGEDGETGEDDPAGGLVQRIRALLEEAELGGFLRSHGSGPIRVHQLFRVSVSLCPNACSQPQIRDVGIIAAAAPVFTENGCVQCGACENACRENAVWVDADKASSVIDHERCIACGACIPVCPTGRIGKGTAGFRVMIGGKLGRHPRLATELPGIYDVEAVLRLLCLCLDEYKQKSTKRKRFADIVAEEKDSLPGRLAAAFHETLT